MSNVAPGSDQATDPYVVRAYEPGDREGFLSLYESVWGFSKSPAWFDWRFEENPYRDGVDMVVVERDGDLVGAEPLLPFRMRAGDEEVLAYQPVDWIVHPDHRRRGLFTRMTERLLDDYADEGAFLYNFPTDVLLAGLENFEWTVVGTVPSYHRVQRPSALLEAASKRGKVSGTLASTARTTDPLVRGYFGVRDRFGRSSTDVTIERSTDLRAADLVEVYRAGRPDRVHVARDETYVRWRYSNPAWETATYLAREDGEPVAGVVVLTESHDDVSRTCLLDVQPMQPGPAAADALGAIVGAIVADHRDTDVLKAEGTELPTASLRRWGFRSGDSFPLSTLAVRTTLVVRPLGSAGRLRFGGRDLADVDDWLLCLGDQDIE